MNHCMQLTAELVEQLGSLGTRQCSCHLENTEGRLFGSLLLQISEPVPQQPGQHGAKSEACSYSAEEAGTAPK